MASLPGTDDGLNGWLSGIEDGKMTAEKGTETPQTIEAIGHRDWERAILGDNSIAGSLRIIAYIAVFVVVFGSIFHFAG
jgi:hypothetical protein